MNPDFFPVKPMPRKERVIPKRPLKTEWIRFNKKPPR